MNESDDSKTLTPEGASHQEASSSIPTWMVASSAFTLVVGVIAANSPARIKLVGLFSIAIGLGVGSAIRELARWCHAGPSRFFSSACAAGLTCLALIGSTCESFRLQTSRAETTEKERLAAKLIEAFDARHPGSGVDMTNRSVTKSFRQYLNLRLRALGDWQSPWPECFWIAEVLSGTAAAGWVARLNRR